MNLQELERLLIEAQRALDQNMTHVAVRAIVAAKLMVQAEAATALDGVERGTGQTSRQMLAAPIGATFVVKDGMSDYAIQLSHMLGRGDLTIVWESAILRSTRTWGAVVVDHAVTLSEADAVRIANISINNRIVP